MGLRGFKSIMNEKENRESWEQSWELAAEFFRKCPGLRGARAGEGTTSSWQARSAADLRLRRHGHTLFLQREFITRTICQRVTNPRKSCSKCVGSLYAECYGQIPIQKTKSHSFIYPLTPLVMYCDTTLMF